jgi:hypothetical protein
MALPSSRCEKRLNVGQKSFGQPGQRLKVGEGFACQFVPELDGERVQLQEAQMLDLLALVRQQPE